MFMGQKNVSVSFLLPVIKLINNKTVLLRERKRHTVLRVASTCYAVLIGGGGVHQPVPDGGTPIQSWMGTPSAGRDLGPVELLWDGECGYPPPGEQTHKVKT